MNQRRKTQEKESGDRRSSPKKDGRGSTEFRALMSEFGQLRDTVTEATADARNVETTLVQQNQAILSIAESLAEMRELVSSLKPAELPEEVVAQVTEEQTAEVAVEESKTSEWERIRDAFLAETSLGKEESPLDSTPQEPDEQEEEDTVSVQGEADDLDDFLSELPGAVPVPTTNDAEELRKVILDRDRTIATLVQRLQKRNRREQSLSAEQLADIVDNCPDELAERVESSLKLLNQQVRLGELELSLERARVSRQLSRLEETRERLESNARSLGLSINEDGTIDGEAELRRNAGSKGRRWLGVLGFSH